VKDDALASTSVQHALGVANITLNDLGAQLLELRSSSARQRSDLFAARQQELDHIPS
jgi:hypothetical protein